MENTILAVPVSDAPSSKQMCLARIQQFLSKMQDGVAVLSSGSPLPKDLNIDVQFRAQSSFVYFTGLEESDAILILSTVHPKHRFVLFIKEADEKEKIWTGAKMTRAEAKEATGADEVFPWEDFRKKLPEYLEGAKNLYYSFGLDKATDEAVLSTRHALLRRLTISKWVPHTIYDLEKNLEDFRLMKEKPELFSMQKAIACTEKGFLKAFEETKAGMYEYEIEAILSYVYRREGGGASFPTIVASGEKSTILHYTHNNRMIRPGDLVLVDSGAEYKHYCADVTRTWPVSGKFTAAQKAVYEAVLAAQKSAIASIKPGVGVPQFHQTALEKLVDFLLEEKILLESRSKILEEKLYQTIYPHSTGHWLGMDVHDLGTYYENGAPRTFQPGMVLTVEPGLYFRPEIEGVSERFKGIGIRIEDDILVTDTGAEVLTHRIPKEINDLEKLLAKK